MAKVIDKHDIERKKPIRGMRCTCCGQYYKGRQWHNQDTGHGLGDCCTAYCWRGHEPSEEGAHEYERTYGINGIHYNIPEGEHK